MVLNIGWWPPPTALPSTRLPHGVVVDDRMTSCLVIIQSRAFCKFISNRDEENPEYMALETKSLLSVHITRL